MNLLAMLLPQVRFFADAASCSHSFLGLKTWFAYFPASWFGGSGMDSCSINNNFQLLQGGTDPSGLLLIGLAIVDDLLRIGALVAVGYVIYGGFSFMTSGGSSDKAEKARNAVLDALVGLVIAVLAAAIVSFIGNKIGG